MTTNMKRIDKYETIAAIAMHVERERHAGRVPESTMGAYSVALLVCKLDRASKRVRYLATCLINGEGPHAARTDVSKRTTERLIARTEKQIATLLAPIHGTASVDDVGWVTVEAGAYRLGVFPFSEPKGVE